MTTVSILPIINNEGSRVFQAIAGDRHVNGNTPGEALDAIRAELCDPEANTLVVLQNGNSDGYFTEQQRSRLQLLMQMWRVSRDTGSEFSIAERSELDALVQAELLAASERARVMADSLIK